MRCVPASPRLVRGVVLALVAMVVFFSRCATASEDPLASAIAAEAAGDLETAGRIYATLADGDLPTARALVLYGEFLRFRRADPAGAERRFAAALTHPGDPAVHAFAWRGLGEVARHRGQIDDARRDFDRSLALFPLAATHRSYVDLLAYLGDDAGAAEHSAAALAIEPDDPLALLLDATLQQRAGRSEAGVQACRRAMGLLGCDARGAAATPVHCCALYNLACYHAECGRRDDALAVLAAFFATPGHLHIERAWMLADRDLRSLRSDPGFLTLLDQHLPATP